MTHLSGKLVGDFIEFYDEEAKIVAEVLEVALTKRTGRDNCGVREAASEEWVPVLEEAGYIVEMPADARHGTVEVRDGYAAPPVIIYWQAGNDDAA